MLLKGGEDLEALEVRGNTPLLGQHRMPPARAFTAARLRVSPPAVLAAARALVPQLTDGLRHKGAHGKVLIVGGSLEYTGAPFYAGMSALRTGADLVWVCCSEACATPLKAQSPELMVLPLIPADTAGTAAALAALGPVLQRVHALVLGPGLGRSEAALAFAAEVIRAAARRDPPLPTVIDADGLYLLSLRPELLAGHPVVLLTPNAVELERLTGKMLVPGCIILRKDAIDCVLLSEADAVSEALPVLATVEGAGSPRRCGGQGDLLAGAAGTFLAWAVEAAAGEGVPLEGGRVVAAAVGASALVRTAASIAFGELRRGTLTPDILRALPEAFEHCMEEEEEEEEGGGGE